jgi:predicted GNAT family acetyltransferase
MEVRDNPEESRYELLDGGDVVGEILYRRYPDRIVLVHTEILPAREGQGLASRLVAGGLDDIRATGGLRVVPVCPFVRGYLRRHPEYEDLVIGAQVAD